MKSFSLEAAKKHTDLALLTYSDEAVIRDKIRPLGYEMFAFIDEKKADTQCYVAESPKEILVVFKGTDSPRDFWTDINILLVPYPKTRRWFCKPKVHAGFLNAFKSVEATIYRKIDEIRAVNPRVSQITVIGYSLGAGIGAIAAISLKTKYSLQTNFTGFAMPRSCNRWFARLFAKKIDTSFVIANDKDLVPKIPPRTFGYRHLKQFVLLDDEKRAIVSPKRYEKLEAQIEAVVSALEGEALNEHMMHYYVELIEKIMQNIN